MRKELLSIQNLKTFFFTREGVIRAVDGVNLEIREGETLGLVGESGCGKSTVALSILRLVPDPGRIVDGKLIFKGEDLLVKEDEYIRKIRGKEIAMIFQNPMTSLNPVFSVGRQISEAIALHQGLNENEATKKAIDMLKLVGIPEAEKRAGEYPHEFSGGMVQRAMIAMALSCNPSLLIADEPTTALDVTIQAQVLGLMTELKERFSASILIITHDIGVIAEISDRVAVMYAGNLMECADADVLFEDPKHPYTRGLMKAIPRPDVDVEQLEIIRGVVPNMLSPPPGCRFHPRCPYAKEMCKMKRPELIEVEPEHSVACFLYS